VTSAADLGLLVGAPTFERRIRAMRCKRATTGSSRATALAVWILGFGALTIIVGIGPMTFR
jgi:hypothetical protein